MARPGVTCHPDFHTVAVVAGVTVTGMLPGTAWRPKGVIEISGDVHRLCCDHALDLADALLLVVCRMDVVYEERYGTIDDTACAPGG